MSAFQSYTGAYESRLGSFRWRCYATARIYEARQFDHSPFPRAPKGRKWLRQNGRGDDPRVAWLVDEHVTEFSQILLHFEPFAPAPAVDLREQAIGESAAL